MSATEAATTTAAPAAPVEEVIPAETTPAPATEIPNAKEAVVVATEAKQEAKTEEAPAPTEATPAEGEAAPAATEEPTKGEVDPVKGETQKEERSKNSNPLIKFFTSIKGKAKGGPRSPKKKKEEVEAPAAEEAPKEEAVAAEPAAEAPEAEEAPATDPVKETETAAPAPATEVTGGKKAEKTEEKKEDGKKRRLSSFIPTFGKSKSKSEVPTSTKVNENPPKIEEPTPVAPLTHPAPDPTSAVESKPEEATTEATPTNPIVAAAA